MGPHQNGKVTDAAPSCTTGVNRTGVQTLVCRFVSGFGFVFVRQTFVFGDRAAIACGIFSEAERVELEARRERLRLELRLIEAELRGDAAVGAARGRPAVEVSARDAYLRKLYGGR